MKTKQNQKHFLWIHRMRVLRLSHACNYFMFLMCMLLKTHFIPRSFMDCNLCASRTCRAPQNETHQGIHFTPLGSETEKVWSWPPPTRGLGKRSGQQCSPGPCTRLCGARPPSQSLCSTCFPPLLWARHAESSAPVPGHFRSSAQVASELHFWRLPHSSLPVKCNSGLAARSSHTSLGKSIGLFVSCFSLRCRDALPSTRQDRHLWEPDFIV